MLNIFKLFYVRGCINSYIMSIIRNCFAYKIYYILMFFNIFFIE